MPQPTKYVRTFDFTDFQEDFPEQPLSAPPLDANLDLAAISINQTIDRVALIQRDDGALRNQAVTLDSLSTDVLALMGSPLVPRGEWVTLTVYAALDLVSHEGSTYIVVTAHTSGVFDTDLAAGKLQFFSRSLQEGTASFFQKLSGDGVETHFTLTDDVGNDPNALMIFYNDGGTDGFQIMDPALYQPDGVDLDFDTAPIAGASNVWVFAPSLLVGAALSAADDAEDARDAAIVSQNAAAASAVLAQAAQAAAEAAAGGLRVRPNTRAATTGILPACTYNNNGSGVGATLTGNSNGALAAVDGVTLILNDEVLVKNQITSLQNGTYVVTQVGTGGTPFILTRRTDADTWAELVSMVITVTSGTTLASTTWITSVLAGGTVGTTAITFVPFNTSILDGSVTTQKLADAAVTAAKLASNLALPGVPTVPATPAVTDNSLKLATTAYVDRSGNNSQGLKTISTSAPSGSPATGDIWYRI